MNSLERVDREDLPVEEPRSRVVSDETNGDFISPITDTDNIATNGIRKVVGAVSCASDDAEGVLSVHVRSEWFTRLKIRLTPCKWKGWGPPATPPDGKLSSIDLLEGRE